jgi:catalase
MPKVLKTPVAPEVTKSPALSLTARPGDGSLGGKRVAILIADGVQGEPLRAIADRLAGLGAVPRFVASTLGRVAPMDGEPIEVDVSIDATPSVLYDAVVVPDGEAAVERLSADGRAVEFVKDQYRHCKPILVFGAGAQLLEKAGLTRDSRRPDPGLIAARDTNGDAADAFVKALATHRFFERETNPPMV